MGGPRQWRRFAVDDDYAQGEAARLFSFGQSGVAGLAEASAQGDMS